jgi:hypothetical protein
VHACKRHVFERLGECELRIYVASSWRNERQPGVVSALRGVGHEVYDFRDPCGDGTDTGFYWSEIDLAWKEWSPAEFKEALRHPVAARSFATDWGAMQQADVGVLVMPCGRSAHLEAGYFVGAGKPLFILLSDGEPELMYRMAAVHVSLGDLIAEIGRP